MMLPTTIRTIQTAALTAGLLAFSTPAMADYPEKPIRIIVHAGAGGGTDNMVRAWAKFANEAAGVESYIDNMTGAGGQIGYTALAAAESDGYTIGTITTMSITNLEIIREVDFTLADSLTPICRMVFDPSGVFVNPNSEIQNLDELVAASKASGRPLTVASTMNWGAHHVHLKMLEDATGTKFTYVPFDKTADVGAAIMGGHADIAVGALSYFGTLAEQGKLRGIVSAADERSVFLPSLETYEEQGYDQILVGSSRGIAAPAGMPQEVIDYLEASCKAALESPEFRAEAEKIQVTPIIAYLGADDFRSYLLDLQDNMRVFLKDVK
ncbi:MAG: tripartite tricarboxylate transporter substrate binding protein [Marinosulfonomonas sp.]|nr:tripartite tricarboxylate transporter substrate binding protein [Marinosulfonomonas sp.]